MEEPSNKRKACDHCKTSRTRCIGARPCARCVDKNLECVTTIVKLGRPRKNEAPGPRRKTAPSASLESPGKSSESEAESLSLRPVEVQLAVGASQNLMMGNLLETFSQLPMADHVSHSLVKLVSLVHSHAPFSQFSSAQTTLLHIMLAVASLASPHVVPVDNALSLHTLPANSLAGLDLRQYGKARIESFQSLRHKAYNLAKEEEIALECSVDNSSSCLLMGFLDSRDKGKYSRPYAAAYVSHLRTMAENDSLPDPSHERVYWIAGRLSNVALNCIAVGCSVPITTQDMLTLVGSSGMSLESSVEILKTTWTGESRPVYDCFVPYCLTVFHLATEGYRIFTSLPSQKAPLDDVALYNYLTSLSSLKASLDVITSHAGLHTASLSPSDRHYRPFTRMSYFLTMSWAVLYLPVYREIIRRSSLPQPPLEQESELFDKLALIVRQETVMAGIRVSESVRDIFAISLLTHIQYHRTEEWLQMLLREDETAKGMGLDILDNLKWLIQGLKLAGWTDIYQGQTIEEAELYLATEETKRTLATTSQALFSNSSSTYTMDLGSVGSTGGTLSQGNVDPSWDWNAMLDGVQTTLGGVQGGMLTF